MNGRSVRYKFGQGRRSPATVQRPEANRCRPGPARAARMLALAHHVERAIEAGTIPDYAAAARALGVTRARLTQLLNLLLLAPEIQERVLRNQIATERRLRVVVGEANWEDQLALGRETSHDSVGDAEWLLEQAARSRWRRCAGPSASGAPATG